MKKIKLIMPLVASVAALAPAVMMTACNNKDENITSVTEKSLTSANSAIDYKFKIKNVPTDKKVVVNIINVSETQEQVYIYNSNSAVQVNVELPVEDDGTVTVCCGYALAPSVNASSDFGLTFSYKSGDNTITELVDGLKFNYNLNYGENLFSEQYAAKQTAPGIEHWTSANETVGEIYTKDILKNPEIFQDDARYSTSSRIRAIGDDFKVDEFQSYFNDIEVLNNGLFVHMNYHMKGTGNDSIFKFVQSETKETWTFTNFDINFSFETHDGYTIKYDKEASSADQGVLKIIDPNYNEQAQQPIGYLLDGRFSGSFHYKLEKDGGSVEEKDVNWSGIINNYQFSYEADSYICSMFAFGVIHLTYNFQWGQHPSLTILSPYTKNAKQQ